MPRNLIQNAEQALFTGGFEMSKRESLLRQLSSAQFALWELHIYLDTHPTDLEAISLHEKYEKKLAVLKKEFEANFGPLTPTVGEGVNWLQDPWPWEAEGREN